MSTTVGFTGRPPDASLDAPVTDPVESASPGDGRSRYRAFVCGPWGNALAIVVFAVSVAAVFWFIHRYAVNVVYFDQWTDISVIQRAHDGTLTPLTLWVQHNENRIFFPNLVVLALAYTTHFNVVIEDYLSGVLWCGATGLLIVAHKRRQPRIPWLYYCPVALVLWSFIPLGDVLFGFNLSWCLVMAGLAAALFLLDRPTPSRLVYAGAVLAAVVGSYSSLQGLFIWPAGLALLLLRRRSRKAVSGWVVAAVATVVVYFIGFNTAAAGGSRATVANPLSSLHFLFAVIGNVVGSNIDPHNGAVNAVPLILGFIVVAIAIWAVVRTIRSGQRGGSPLGVALICFGLIFAATITVGRMQFGLSSTARYSIFTLTIWVGAYLALLAPPTGWPKAATALAMDRFDHRIGLHGSSSQDDDDLEPAPPAPWGLLVNWLARIVLVVLLVLQVGLATGQGMLFASAWRSQELTVVNVESNLTAATRDNQLSLLGGYIPQYILPLARFAQAQRLGPFDTPLYTENRRQGLMTDLLIQIQVPTGGARLSGTTLVAASASARYGHDTVEFRVTGQGLHNHVVVATAVPYFVGWSARWNTTNVPNGFYKLTSVIVRPGGRDTVSRSVRIEVLNPRSRP